MKRSRSTALLLMSTTPLWLSACHHEPAAQEGVYTSVDACVTATNDRVTCQQAFDKAKADALAQAPRYAGREECAADWGDQHCEQHSDGGQGFFSPLMTGFFLSQMIRNGRPMNGFSANPAFQDNHGSWKRPSTGSGCGGSPTSGGYGNNNGCGNSSSPRGGSAGFRGSPFSATGSRGLIAINEPVDRAITISRGGFGRSGGSHGEAGG